MPDIPFHPRVCLPSYTATSSQDSEKLMLGLVIQGEEASMMKKGLVYLLFIACSLPLIHHNVLHFQQQKCTFLTTIEDFKIILIRTITINLASKIGMAYVCS